VYYRDDLFLFFWIQRHQREAVDTIDAGKVLGYPIPQVLHTTVVAQADRQFAKTPVQPL
jgi:hypothetical protein